MPIETKEPVKIKKSTAKWKLNQDDYLELLKSIDTNAKTIVTLTHDVKKLKTRLGI